MIEALDHVAVAVSDLDAATSAYEAFLGRRAERWGEAGGADRAWIQTGNMAIELIAPAGDGAAGTRVRARLDAAGEGLWLIAFAVRDRDSAARTLERRAIPGERADGPAGRAFRCDAEATHGVQIVLVERKERREPSPALADPSAVVAGLDHVVVATPDPDRAASLYGARLGLDLRLDRSNAQWGSRLMFFRCGDLVVEIGARLGAAPAGGPDKLSGLAWRVADPNAAQARLAAAGFDVSEVRTGRKPGTEVFTLRSGVAGAPSLMIAAASAA
jgi:catechol 2,3-dioxygenase-like lactoylglutathione lyase family enzyme